ncbi:DNA-binding protein [Kitasatospora sp. NPDC047058]|uniref:DNA-binding protein n=1 Tax=Kitasatospora sp. NPDC047058 TaxID=3155620 RepID=UPI0033FA2737
MKTWTDSLPQIPFAYRDLPAGGQWMTQEEAASWLGIGQYHLNVLTAVTHRIDLVRTTGREFAVTRASVEAEKDWRTTASFGQKVLRLLKDVPKLL